MDAINHVHTIPVQRPCSLPAVHFSQPKALGIEAASFASILRQQTTDNSPREFLSEEKTESEQRYSGKPDGFAGTPKLAISS